MVIEVPILSLGSCFSVEMGGRLNNNGCEVLINPFGVLYNPASIANSLQMLEDPDFRFRDSDVIERDPYYCAKRNVKGGESVPLSSEEGHRPIAPCVGGFTSFFHHGSFTRATAEEFLADANASLALARTFYGTARTVIVTFGTAWVFRNLEKNLIVSNCHKHRADEFRRERLSVEDIVRMWLPILEKSDKKWIFTVSPIRHPKDGLHGNQVSKSILLLACEELCSRFPESVIYFPSYEFMMDELRDYKWYKDDKIHPSDEAVDYIFSRFVTDGIPGA